MLGMLAGAGWLVLNPQRPGRTLTSYGRPVSDAGSLLRQTESTMRRLAHDRHGVLTTGSRCYYTSQPDDDSTPAGG
ncbi:MAG TPA: hypothetical protein VFU36_16260, partial [Jatrophihabitans sp.]|nr:hypothetical protein [Jatrophihabitans sp.]